MFGILCVCFDIEENMFYLYEKSLDGIVCWVYVIGRNICLKMCWESYDKLDILFKLAE
jgi:hypothetical protein